MRKAYILILGTSFAFSSTFMDAKWAHQICKAWNKSPVLTQKLFKWAQNNGGKGYKIVRMYRDNCGKQRAIELKIAPKNGKAVCVASGKATKQKENFDVDYLMHATDKDWTCMGKGSFGCGPMGAMLSGKLKFQGPKMEAMGVMNPFGEFLKLTGSIPASKKYCPR